ncbi:MAG: flagellar biosynthesis protein [Clostridia bacterium]|nr:flagellar biosynthesis protein [Clostridia bacterium]
MTRIDWQPLTPLSSTAPKRPAVRTKAAGNFQQLLTEKISGLKFSRHACERLEDRRLKLSAEQMQRLEQGVQQAASKGARESLVLLDDLALVVSIRNRTVVTAAARQELRDRVFTNIDSAVLL